MNPVNAPVAASYGQSKGELQIKTNSGKTLSLESKSNGTNEGTLNGNYQCPELIYRYGKELGMSGLKSINDIGSGKDAAKNFAAQSNGQFKFIDAASAKAPPTVGSVISFGAWPGDSAGHVGIAQKVTQVSPNQLQVTLFDQNFPGKQWKTVTFTKHGTEWKGAMPNQPIGQPAMTVTSDGWANPI